ncbi:hypothetical protein EsDP_00005273 [Epichloe bromicola]|uniref:Uncharacterized protein n=1 Tax=Epichloe bromicola TaxID=79588 RepID=A0ABQ0CUA7_9HYPO
MQNLSAVNLSLWLSTSSPETNGTLHKRSHQSTKSSGKLQDNEDEMNMSSRPLSWLTSVKSQRPESLISIRRDGDNYQAASPFLPVKNRHTQTLTATSPVVGWDTAVASKGYIERPATTDDSHQLRWAESVHILTEETEEAFQAVRDFFQHDAEDDADIKSWLADGSHARIFAPSSEFYPESIQSRAAFCQERQLASPLPVLERVPSPHDKPLPPHPKEEQEEQQKVPMKIKKARKERSNKLPSMLKGLQGKKYSKWTLPVTEILRGTRFMRVEVDEMLTPEQIQQIRAERLKSPKGHYTLEGRQSIDSAESESSRSSKASASTVLSGDHLLSYPATSPMDHAVVHKDFSVPQGSLKDGDGVTLLQEQRNQSVRHPEPPPKNPERGNKRPQRLPTIPEAESENYEGTVAVGPKSKDDGLQSRVSQKSVDATPCPAASSSLQHVHALCQENELVLDKIGSSNHRSEDAPCRDEEDDGLRTALYEQDDDFIASDMASWFQAFGFESHGQLIQDGVASKSCGDPLTVRCASSSGQTSVQSIASTTPSTVASELQAAICSTAETPRNSLSAPIRFLTTQGPPRTWISGGQPPVQYNLRDFKTSCKLAGSTMRM